MRAHFCQIVQVHVFYDSLICRQEYWSVTAGNPALENFTQNYDLITASENGSTTVVEFSRDAITGDTADGVEFEVRLHSNVKCFILWKRAKKNYWYEAYMGDSPPLTLIPCGDVFSSIFISKKNLILLPSRSSILRPPKQL